MTGPGVCHPWRGKCRTRPRREASEFVSASRTANPLLSRRSARPGRFLLLLAALLAFSWQSFVVQTHRHDGVGIASAAGPSTAGAAQVRAAKAPADRSDHCPICREIAQAGHCIAPTGVALHIPAISVLALVSTVASAFRLGHRSHGWLSRAPPLSRPT